MKVYPQFRSSYSHEEMVEYFLLTPVETAKVQKRLPELLTDHELVGFYEAVWHARNPIQMIIIKLLIYTGLRNAELARVRLQDVDSDHCQVHVVQGKSSKDRSVLFPSSFRGELGQYIHGRRERRAVFLFESNRLRPYSTRRVRQIISNCRKTRDPMRLENPLLMAAFGLLSALSAQAGTVVAPMKRLILVFLFLSGARAHALTPNCSVTQVPYPSATGTPYSINDQGTMLVGLNASPPVGQSPQLGLVMYGSDGSITTYGGYKTLPPYSRGSGLQPRPAPGMAAGAPADKSVNRIAIKAVEFPPTQPGLPCRLQQRRWIAFPTGS